MNPRSFEINGRIIHADDDQAAFWAKAASGRWEPRTLDFIDRFVDAGATFLDCGAWVGPTSLYAAFQAKRVIAVEADPSALSQLRRNLAANPALATKIEVVSRALHPLPGTVTMGARRKPGDSMSSVLLAGAPRSWQADAITPRDLAATLAPGNRLIVKIDLEGGEYALLPHLGPILHLAAAIHLSLHPAYLHEALEGDRGTARRLAGRALAALSDFDGAPSRADAAGDYWLTRPPPPPLQE